MDGYRKEKDGRFCSVWISPKAAKIIESATASDRRKTGRYLEELAKNGREFLHNQQFKYEGKFPSGKGDDYAVYVVRGHLLRIYGGFVGERRKKFVCPEAAIKKRDKADQKQLKRVAKALGETNG